MTSDKPSQGGQPAPDASEAFRHQLTHTDQRNRTTHDKDGVDTGGVQVPPGAKPHIPMEHEKPTVIVITPIPGHGERPHNRYPEASHPHVRSGDGREHELQMPPIFSSSEQATGGRATRGAEATGGSPHPDKPGPTVYNSPDGSTVTVWQEGGPPPTVDEVAAAMGVQRPPKHAEKK